LFHGVSFERERENYREKPKNRAKRPIMAVKYTRPKATFKRALRARALGVGMVCVPY
jgi:hypothetical protein